MALPPLSDPITATGRAGSKAHRLADRLVRAVGAGDDKTTLAAIAQVQSSGQDPAAAALLTAWIVRGAPAACRLPDGSPDMGTLTHTTPQDLKTAGSQTKAFGPDPQHVRATGGQAREVIQKAATLAQSLPERRRDSAATQLFAREFRLNPDLSAVVLSLLAEACLPLRRDQAAPDPSAAADAARYLANITDKPSADRALEQARRDGFDLGHLRDAAGERLTSDIRRLNNPKTPGTGVPARVEALNHLIESILIAEPAPPQDDQPLELVALLVEAARNGDTDIVADLTTLAQRRELLPSAVGILVSNLNRTCPDDARTPDGRPDFHYLCGTTDQEKFLDRQDRHTPQQRRETANLWTTTRAAVELLEAAQSNLRTSGHQDKTMTLLRTGFAARPKLIAPAVRAAAEAVALCTASAGLDPGSGQERAAIDYDGHAQRADPSTTPLPPLPLPGGERYEDDPVDAFDFAQPAASLAARWRDKLARHLATPEAFVQAVRRIDHRALRPAVASRLRATKILLGQEQDRLRRATLYHLNGRLTGLATAQRFAPRATPITWDRIRTQVGFMTFERPIAAGPDIPIVAVSWSPWHAGWEPYPDAAPQAEAAALDRPAWWHRDPHADPEPRKHYFDATATLRGAQAGLLAKSSREYLWVTFYSPAPAGAQEPLARVSDLVVPIGAHLPEGGPGAGSRLSWLRALLAAWDRQTDPERRPGDVAAVERAIEVPRPDHRAKGKKGKSTPRRADTVHVVTDEDIPPARRCPADPQVQVPAPRTEPEYGLVIQTKGTQSHCFAPRGEHRRHLEAGQPCPHHRDIPLTPQYRRHPDLPLRTTQTVHKPT
ncbi:hypothetical protein [Kitasatospora sp. LaBMicrA B282]|uniref:hypothetical protein n=1 Tax=Kitasatospora sp. LaBMicrA B282 TaxID=3420949 RepID=UPI003D13D671